MINLAVGEQVFQRHLHEHDHLVFRTIAVLHKHAARCIQHVVRGVGYRPKIAALNQDRFFVEHLGRLNRLAVRLEHNGIRETLADELQTHQSIIDALKDGSGKFNHVHLDSSRIEIFVKRRN